MDKLTLRQFEDRCTQEEPPACQTACPLHVEARTLTRLTAEGKIGDVRKLLDRYMPLNGLIGYLCEGPCRESCRRAELDRGIDMPLLERYCLAHSGPTRVMAMPGTGKEAAVVGGGLSSLTAAWELGKKGHRITVFHCGPVGGRLLSLAPERLPETVLPSVLEQLRQFKVTFTEVPAYCGDLLDQAAADFVAVFLGFDDPALRPEDLNLTPVEVETGPVTLAVARPGVFACPPQINEPARFIDASAAGKRAAGSIDRILQGGSPASARDGEGPYATRLFTSLEGIEPQPQRLPADPLKPTEEEARTEGGRCIQCQCLECVKRCVFLKHYKGYPKKYARVMYNNILTAFGIRHNNTMINSCAECGLCGEICPNNADMGGFCALARRDMVETNHMPVSAHEFALEDQAFTNSPGIAFYRSQPGLERSEWLFFPGCQLPASMPKQTAGVYGHLSENLSGGVGFFLACCGAPARWSGRPRFTGQTAAFLRETWEQAGRPKLILACASCRLFFQAELADIPAVSLWEVLSGLPLSEGALAAAETLALHDPCAARYDEEAKSGVRKILSRLGQPVAELPLSGRTTRCCGYGGLADAANPAMGEAYARSRAEDTELNLLAYCVMCGDRLKAVGKPALHLLDLMFPSGPPEEALKRPGPGLSDRQETRRGFRHKILHDLWGEALAEDEVDIIMNIGPEAAQKMEKRRILRSDVAEVIRYAEENGAQFVNPGDNRLLACLRPRQVTFWVEYSRRDDGSYDIHDAYCHRMVVPGVDGEGADSPASLEGYDAKGGRR